VERALTKASNKLSPARKQVVSALLTDIALRTFDKQEHREYWIALIGAESGFDGSVHSKAGAVGLGQLMPQFKEAFTEACGLGSAEAVDLRDDYSNATLSACFFRHLIETTGSVPMALVAYNSGPNSHATKAAKSGGRMNVETANYATKIWLTKEGK
jgi:soluble lytic murein transglycosylase-like protein